MCLTRVSSARRFGDRVSRAKLPRQYLTECGNLDLAIWIVYTQQLPRLCPR